MSSSLSCFGLRPCRTVVGCAAAMLVTTIPIGCSGGGDEVIHSASFNETLTTRLESGSGLSISDKFRPSGSPGNHLVTDAISVGVDEQTPRATCFWAPLGSEVDLTWEVAINGSVGSVIATQDIGSCTMTHPVTRQPITDTDGDDVEIEQEDWEDFFEDNNFNPTVTISRLHGNVFRDDFCAPASNLMTATTLPPTSTNAQKDRREPLCMRSLRVPLTAGAGSSESEVHGDTNFLVGISGTFNDEPMPVAIKSFSTSFKGVAPGGRSIRRPLSPKAGFNDWFTWHAAFTNSGGPWSEAFSPDLFLTRVRVLGINPNSGVTETLGIRELQAVPLPVTTFGNSVCPLPPGMNPNQPDYTTLAFHSTPGSANCPNLVAYNPTIERSTVDRLLEYAVHVPNAPAGYAMFIEFEVGSTTPGGLTAAPGAYNPVAAYPGYYEWLEERFRASNWGESTVHLNIEIDGTGRLVVDLPEEGVDVPPGQTATVTIGVTTEDEGSSEEVIRWSMTDPETGEVLAEGETIVPVVGHLPSYTVSPTPGPSGVVLNTQTLPSEHFVIENVGYSDVEIFHVPVSGSSEFTVQGLPSLPAVLGPGDRLEFDLDYTPASNAPASGVLSILTDRDVRNIPLVGVP